MSLISRIMDEYQIMNEKGTKIITEQMNNQIHFTSVDDIYRVKEYLHNIANEKNLLGI